MSENENTQVEPIEADDVEGHKRSTYGRLNPDETDDVEGHHRPPSR